MFKLIFGTLKGLCKSFQALFHGLSISGRVVDGFDLEGESFRIRYPKLTDLNDLLEHKNSLVEEEVKNTRKKKKTKTEELKDLLSCFKNLGNKKAVKLVVEHKNKVLGIATIFKRPGRESHVGSVGLTLNKEIRNKGIGTRLTETLIEEAKSKLEVKIILSWIFENNEKSIGMFRKLGFKKVGRIDEGVHYKGKDIDEILMQKTLDY